MLPCYRVSRSYGMRSCSTVYLHEAFYGAAIELVNSKQLHINDMAGKCVCVCVYIEFVKRFSQ